MFINIIIKLVLNIKQTIKSRKNITILTHFIVFISIIYYRDLSKDRDILFELQYFIDLSIKNNVITYIVNVLLLEILVRNTSDTLIQLSSRNCLNTIVNYN